MSEMSEQNKLSSAQRAYDNQEPDKPWWLDQSLEEEEEQINRQSEWDQVYNVEMSRLPVAVQQRVLSEPGCLPALRLKWKVEDIIYKRRELEAWEKQQAYPKGRWS